MRGPGAARQDPGTTSDRLERVRRLGQQWVDRGTHQSLVLLAMHRGEVVLQQAYGRIHPEPDAPATQLDTIFPMSSISKVITATCAMLLVEDGLLGLNRPVQEYVPEFVGDGKDGVMVHHLLTHTSGWDEEVVYQYAEARRGTVEIPSCPPTQHPAVHEMLCLQYDAPLTQPPGQEMSYCSPGYDLLGEIVRRASGRSLNDVARERIFDLLGMSDTTYVMTDEKQHRVVRRRPLDPPPFGLDDPEYHRQPWGEAGVLSTAPDMAAFVQMFLDKGVAHGQRVLSPATVHEMTRDQIPGISSRLGDEVFPDAGWSYGWAIKGNKKAPRHPSLDSPQTFSHGGSGGVYIWADPAYGIVGVYFSISAARVPFQPDWCVDLFGNALTAALL